MGLDYCILYPCEIQKSYPPETLVQNLKVQAHLKGIKQRLKKNGKDISSEYQIVLPLCTRGPNAVESGPIMMGDLDGQFDSLTKMGGKCENCPMNVNKRPFGCCGNVVYPISRKAEKWLLSLLPDSLEDPRSENLDTLFPSKTKKELDAERHQKYIFAESVPLVRKWDIGDYKKNISAKQVFDVLVAFRGNAPSLMALALSWVFGFLKDKCEQFTDEEMPANVPNDQDEKNIYEFKCYLRALACAASHDRSIFIDG